MDIDFSRGDIEKIVATGHDEVKIIKDEAGIYLLTRDPHMVVFSPRGKTANKFTKFVHQIPIRELQAVLAIEPPLQTIVILVLMDRVKNLAIVRGA